MSAKSNALLGPERGGAEEVVVGEDLFGRQGVHRFDRHALARDHDLPGAEQAQGEELHHVEFPTVGRLAIFGVQRLALGRDAVVVLAGDPGTHLQQRAGVGDQHGGAPLDAQELEGREHGGQAAEIGVLDQGHQVAAGDPCRAHKKAIEDRGQGRGHDGLGRFDHGRRALVRATIAALEEDRTVQKCLLEQPADLAFVFVAAAGLLGNQASLRPGLGAPLVLAEHFLGLEHLRNLAVDPFIELNDPQNVLRLGLAAAAGLGGQALEFGLVIGQQDMDLDVALDPLTAVEEEPALEDPGVQERVLGLRLPQLLHDDVAEDLVGVGAVRFQARAAGLPVILGRGGDAVAVVALADLVGRHEGLQGLADLGPAGIAAYGRVQRGRDVVRRAVDTFDELEQADGLGHGLRHGVYFLGRDALDLVADVAVDVVAHQVVDVVDTHQVAYRMIAQSDLGMGQELLGQLDDRAVGAADVAAGPALGPQAGNDVDHQVDLVGQHGIEVDERLAGQLRQADVGRKGRVGGKAATVPLEQIAQGLLGVGIFGQYALAGHLGDVAGLQVDGRQEAVHEPGQLHAGVVQAADQFVELLLRRDDDPEFPLADAAQGLDDALEVEHLIDAAGNELADFVDHEDQAAVFAPAETEFLAAVGQVIGADVGPRLGALDPGVGGRVGLTIQLVHDPAGLAHGQGDEVLRGPTPCSGRDDGRSS